MIFKNKTTTTIVFLGFFLIFSSIFLSNLLLTDNPATSINSVEENDEIDLKGLKSSGFWDNFTFIRINGNWSNAVNWGWVTGDGSWEQPYVLRDIYLNASKSPHDHGIWIEDSKNDYFEIRNCTVFDVTRANTQVMYAGIFLDNSCNGTIIDCNTSNNQANGIKLKDNCYNNTIINCTTNDNMICGIRLESGASYNTIKNNTASDVEGTAIGYYQMSGIYLSSDCDFNNISENIIEHSDSTAAIHIYNSDFNNINNNTVIDNDGSGIYLTGTSGSDYNTIYNNEIFDCFYGVSVQSGNHSIIYDNIIYECGSRGIYLNGNFNNTIINNTIFDVSGGMTQENGIYATGEYNLTLIENTIYDHIEEGIYLTDCLHSILTENSITNNDDGIVLYNCNDTIISNGTISLSDGSGIELDDCNDTIISNNQIHSNEGAGIYLDNSNETIIYTNNISFNEDGVYLTNSEDNTIIENGIDNNTDSGIRLENSCYDNIIGENNITKNLGYGLVIVNDSTECQDNTIYDNHFNNTYAIANALDNCSLNTWNGNWWHDYSGCGSYTISGVGGAEDSSPTGPLTCPSDPTTPGSSDDDDDDDDDDESAAIPGYTIFIILSIIGAIVSVIAIVFLKKRGTI